MVHSSIGALDDKYDVEIWLMKSQYNLKIDFLMIPDVLFNEHNMKTKLNDYIQILPAFWEANA